ncbi:porin [Oricola indica]|jgi:hypothetical protein|uniref:porin n=1 Tax=Oricola indica TaxID=2872591 RepID=UPI001CC16674|nr:porin [Oricola indica]
MKIKSLLLGSAAALVAVSGARAADAVIIPEPEMVEYVRVCDAAGAGYFYIPGSETCLKIAGWARFEIGHVSFDSEVGDNWATEVGDEAEVSFSSTGQFNISSWTDSEIGPIETYVEFETPGGGDVDLDVVKLSFAGLTMGYFGGFLDNGINGETDSNGLTNKFNSIQYSGTAGAISFGASIDQAADSVVWSDDDGAKFGVTGMLGFSSGAIAATVVGYYDLGMESGGVVVRGSADIGPGTLQGRFTWNQGGNLTGTGTSMYATATSDSPDPGDDGHLHWVAEASYAAQVSDKMTVTPGFSWVQWRNDEFGSESDDRMWTAGVTVDYALAANLAIKANVEYWDFRDANRVAGPGGLDDGTGWRNFLRFQASF